MNLPTLAVLIVLLACLALALRSIWRGRASSCACSGCRARAACCSCSACAEGEEATR